MASLFLSQTLFLHICFVLGQPRPLQAESRVLQATQRLRVRAGLITAHTYSFAYPQTMFETNINEN